MQKPVDNGFSWDALRRGHRLVTKFRGGNLVIDPLCLIAMNRLRETIARNAASESQCVNNDYQYGNRSAKASANLRHSR